MEKKNKIIFSIILILTICVIGLCIYSIFKEKDNGEKDSLKFKNEYMEYNSKYNEVTNKDYINVFISEENNIKYKNEDEILDILEQGTGIIYFGYPTCEYCRNLVPILVDSANELKTDVYYLNILDIRSNFSIENGGIVKVKEGTNTYYKMLDILDKYLNEFYLVDASNNKYDTLEKRIYAPTVVAVNHGRITGIYFNELNETKYDELSLDEEKELKSTLTKMINENNVEVCNPSGC